MKTSALRLVFLVAVLFAAVAPAQAQDLGAVRNRMEQRISRIDALKTQGVLGENNRGFLDVRSGDDEGVAAAENADRATVYEAVARKTGATPEAVGKARAKKIAASSAKGVWLQSEDGRWSKK